MGAIHHAGRRLAAERQRSWCCPPADDRNVMPFRLSPAADHDSPPLLPSQNPWRIVLYALCIGAFLTGWKGAFPLDDSYIVLHSARSLLAGNHDTAYDTSPLTGATSSIHLALVAALGTIMPLPLASLAIAAVSALVYALGLDQMVREAGAQGWKVPALVLLGLTAGGTPINLFNGLETGLAMATTAWLFALCDDRRLPVLAGMAPFVRPELGLLSAILLLRAAWLHGAPIRTATISLLAALPWMTWVWIETGSLVPTTAAAKIAFYAEFGEPLEERIGAVLKALLKSGLLPLYAGIAGISRVRGGWCGALFIGAILTIATVTLPSSVSWNYQRYLGPTVPITVLWLSGFSGLRTGTLAYALLGLYAAFNIGPAVKTLRSAEANNLANIATLDAALRNLPPGSPILIHDAGIASWTHPEARLIDVVGLKTPSSIDFHRKFTHHPCEIGPALDRIARSSHARFAVVSEVEFWSCTRTALEGQGWRFVPMPQPMRGYYRLYRIEQPPALTPPVYSHPMPPPR
ncbi:hypothetical protein H7F51_12295 [Novosphingobium flavum]|uniref:DUF2029 domain-containing protein n=1 Tax=Novosphingobium flavum TaxID=1778672 RepID=A0A7X1KMH5_9SPHN|nr:hypothetical protein [Novosphingobium flavum]MBC2666300.1 hypothetical protein [Novosphingobium flavum]